MGSLAGQSASPPPSATPPPPPAPPSAPALSSPPLPPPAPPPQASRFATIAAHAISSHVVFIAGPGSKRCTGATRSPIRANRHTTVSSPPWRWDLHVPAPGRSRYMQISRSHDRMRLCRGPLNFFYRRYMDMAPDERAEQAIALATALAVQRFL